ncbi:MAG: hypothetical protein LBT34_00200 [Clostridiales Family XIII bacterium]|jgi:hypothetical protein|nr:hypothetical protein [Clostridiales Family XIII bacterium]
MGIKDWFNKQKVDFRAQIIERQAYDVFVETNSQRETARKQAKEQAKQQNLLDSNGKRIIQVGADNPVDKNNRIGEIDDDHSRKLAQNRLDEINARRKAWEEPKRDNDGKAIPATSLAERTLEVAGNRREMLSDIADVYNFNESSEVNATVYGGATSIGGFFGRLFTGRLTQASRDKQLDMENKVKAHPLFLFRMESDCDALEKKIAQYDSETPEQRAERIAQRKAEFAQRKAEARVKAQPVVTNAINAEPMSADIKPKRMTSTMADLSVASGASVATGKDAKTPLVSTTPIIKKSNGGHGLNNN